MPAKACRSWANLSSPRFLSLQCGRSLARRFSCLISPLEPPSPAALRPRESLWVETAREPSMVPQNLPWACTEPSSSPTRPCAPPGPPLRSKPAPSCDRQCRHWRYHSGLPHSKGLIPKPPSADFPLSLRYLHTKRQSLEQLQNDTSIEQHFEGASQCQFVLSGVRRVWVTREGA